MLPEKRSGRYQAYHIRPPDSTLIWGRLKHALLDCQHGEKKKFLGSVKTASYSQVPTTSIAWIMCRMLAKAWLANHAYRSARCDWILYAACRHLIWLGLFLFEGNCITPSIDICKTNTSYHALHRWPHVLMLHDRTTYVYLISPSNLLHREDHCLVVHYPRIPPFMIKSIVK